MANESLGSSVENLYQVFAKYPLKEKIVGCPHCVDDDADCVLHSKPLRKLMAEDLSYFAAKSMTTFGDGEDFRHFLPSMFELMSEGNDVCDYGEEVLIGKLEYAKWTEWNDAEKSAIENFLIELIRFSSDCEKENAYLTETFFVGVANAVEDITMYLNLWLEDISINKIYTLHSLVVVCHYGTSNPFLSELPVQRKQMKDWLNSERTVSVLENLFFNDEKFQQLNELSQILDFIYDLQKTN